MHYGDYLPNPTTQRRFPPSPRRQRREPEPSAEPERYTRRPGTARNEPPSTPQEEPGEILSRLRASVQRIPVSGNEDFWQMVESLGANRGAEVRRKHRSPGGAAAAVRREPRRFTSSSSGRTGSPVPLPRENLTFDFVTGSTTGPVPGRPAAPRSARSSAPHAGADPEGCPGTVRELDALPVVASARGPRRPRNRSCWRSPDPSCGGSPRPGEDGRHDRPRGPPGRPAGLAGFARNLLESGLPWHEAGKTPRRACRRPCPPPRAAPRRELPAAQAGDGNSRLADAYPPTAIAGAIAQACAVARILHTPRPRST